MKRHLWASRNKKTGEQRCLRRGCKAGRRPSADKYEYRAERKGAWQARPPACTGQPTTNK